MKTEQSVRNADLAELDLRDLMDYRALAKLTGESVVTHRRRKMLGTGPRAIVLGRHIRFHPRDVSEWLESRRSEVIRRG